MIRDLQRLMISKKKTVVLAESCTGGFAAHLITKHPGASRYFLGSFVVYQDLLKQSVLRVQKQTLETFGAVSRETVTEMVEGLFAITPADFGVAISGAAGPEGVADSVLPGTVWIAVGERGGSVDTFLLQLSGDREEVISLAAIECLEILYQKTKSR